MTKRGPGPGQRGAAVGQGPGAGGRGASRGRLLPLEAKSLVGSVHLSVSAEQPDGAEVLRIPPGRRGQRHGRCHDPDRTRGQDPQRQELEGCQDHDGQGGHLPGLLEKVRQGAHPRGLPQSLQVSRGPAAPGPVPFSPRRECVVLNPRPHAPWSRGGACADGDRWEGVLGRTEQAGTPKTVAGSLGPPACTGAAQGSRWSSVPSSWGALSPSVSPTSLRGRLVP